MSQPTPPRQTQRHGQKRATVQAKRSKEATTREPVPVAGCMLLLVAALVLALLVTGIASLVSPPVRTAILDRIARVPPSQSIDPIAWYPHAESYVAKKNSALGYTGFQATGVRSDGTLLLTEPYEPEIRYNFAGPLQGSDQPLGATATPQNFDTAYVLVSKAGWKIRYKDPTRTIYYWNRGFELRQMTMTAIALHKDPIAPPRCDTRNLWAQAIEQGFPSDAVAQLEHESAGYRLQILSTDYKLQFDQDCQLIGGDR